MKVITLQDGSSLNEQQFIHYFEKKVLRTLRKYNLFQDIKKPEVKDFFKLKKINNIFISQECLDDIASKVLKAFTKKNAKKELKKLLPLTFKGKKKIIRPFYFVSKKEIELYKKLKKIKIKKKGQKVRQKKEKIQSWLDSMEEKHPEVKNAIVNFLIKLSEFLD